MSGFKSDQFSKQTRPQTQQAPLREFNVMPDDQQYPVPQYANPTQQEPSSFVPPPMPVSPELEQELKQARQMKTTSTAPISPGAKTRIELLASIGRLTRDVKIDNYTFTLRTLKTQEANQSIRAVLAISNTDFDMGLENKKHKLARSIYMIDGSPIEQVLSSDTIESKLSFIDQLEDVVVSRLWDEFSLLNKEAQEKCGIKTAKEAEEVSEDLKK